MPAPDGPRLAAFRFIVLLLSIVFSLAAVEVVLRARYGRSQLATLGGPGPHFAGRRGRLAEGPKTPGMPRIMILGDSITFGQGLADDADLWPERLARRFEGERRPFEMSVYAWPGRDIDLHEQQFSGAARQVEPDVFIYQWFVNDIELAGTRPNNSHWWQHTAIDSWLRRHSYLYFLIDTRLTRLLPPPDRSYVQYLLDDYKPGSLEWESFARTFHNLAARVDEKVPGLKMLVLYPVLPFTAPYPLQPIHDRLRMMAGAHRYALPAATWVRLLGGSNLRHEAAGDVLALPAQATGPALSTTAFYPMRGPMEVHLTIAAPAETRQEIGRVDLMDDLGNVVMSAPLMVDPGGAGERRDATVQLDAHGMTGHYVYLLLHKTAAVAVELTSIALQVDYGFTVVDPTETLGTFDTHVNIYDAHPGARAQQVVADAVYEGMRGRW